MCVYSDQGKKQTEWRVIEVRWAYREWTLCFRLEALGTVPALLIEY